MTNKRVTAEFKAEAVKPLSEPSYPLAELGERLHVSSNGLYARLRQRGISRDARKAQKEVDLVRKTARFRAELVAPKRAAFSMSSG